MNVFHSSHSVVCRTRCAINCAAIIQFDFLVCSKIIIINIIIIAMNLRIKFIVFFALNEISWVSKGTKLWNCSVRIAVGHFVKSEREVKFLCEKITICMYVYQIIRFIVIIFTQYCLVSTQLIASHRIAPDTNLEDKMNVSFSLKFLFLF